jgi:Mitochondrial ribosomal protein L27
LQILTMFKQTAHLLQGSPSSIKRLPLSTKQAANKGGYYKGTRVGSMGWHSRRGQYIIDLRKVRTYVAPEDEKGEAWSKAVEHHSLASTV